MPIYWGTLQRSVDDDRSIEQKMVNMDSPTIRYPFNFNNYQLMNMVAHQGGGFPAGPVEGQIFYRSDLDTLYQYNGASWETISGITTDSAESDGSSNTTSGTYQTKVTLTFTPPSAGDYLIIAQAEFVGVANGLVSQVRVYQDGATVIGEQGSSAWSGSSNDYLPLVVNKIVTLTAAEHTFAIQYRTVDGFWNTYIRRAKVIAIKVD